MPRAPQPRPLRLLERAFTLLELFGDEQPDWTVTELARAAGLPIPTAHRILAVLVARGYVARDEATKRYHLGEASARLGERARGVLDLRRVALPVLRRIARETDETALLTVLNERHDRSVCLDRVESSQPLRLSIAPGREVPLHAGASQKILLAYMAEDERERHLRRRLERVCRGTITERRALEANLDDVRGRGWAISFEENNAGAWGVAVPILDGAGRIVAGLGLAGPSARLSPGEVTDHLRRLDRGAREIASALRLPRPRIDTRIGTLGRMRSATKGESAWQ